MKYFTCLNIPAFGDLTLIADDASLCAIEFGKVNIADGAAQLTPLLQRAKTELEEYFSGQRRTFDLPLAPNGTEFQKKVWAELYKIPYGQTRSYGQIAQALNNPRGCRAVGLANGRNPIPIIIPCHRVIGADGTLTGYAGGLNIKRFLLSLENIPYSD